MSSLATIIAILSTSHAILPENAEIIARLNSESSTATFGRNEFENLTSSEFRRTRLMNIDSTQMLHDLSLKETHKPSITDIPESWDWRDHDAVTPVKNQESCMLIKIHFNSNPNT